MGESDIERLHPIYRACVEFTKLAELPFTFKVDSGNYETAIVFNVESPDYRKAKPHETWDNVLFPEDMKCPDVSDFDNKIAIEFEEETGPRKSGAHLAKKGHGHEGDYDTKRDSRRNDYYSQAGFKVLRIWESHYNHSTIWKLKLFEFLINCAKQRPQT